MPAQLSRTTLPTDNQLVREDCSARTNLRDLPALMIAPYECNSVRIPHLRE